MMNKYVTIWTDGAATPTNPGPGGWACVLLHQDFQERWHRKELSGGYSWTTNNRMELMAVLRGIQALKCPCQVEVVSDSSYVVQSMSKGWVLGWRRQGWRKGKRGGGSSVPNADLWQQLVEVCQQHQVTFRLVRGHDGLAENEWADQLANAAARRLDLPPDLGYRPPSIYTAV